MTEAVRMNAKFAGICQGCKKAILSGEPIIWIGGRGAWHDACYDQQELGIARIPAIHDRRPQGPSPRARLAERAKETVRTGVCELCQFPNVITSPVVLRNTRAAIWICEVCLEDMAAAARRA